MAGSILHYDYVKELGRGGMASVGLFKEKTLNRLVAIKVLEGRDEEKIKRFRREADFSMALKQENLPAVYDYFVNKENVHCIVMEYVDGADLSVLLKKHHTFPPYVAAMIIREIARGLEYLHERGIIHRDIKPSNVRLMTDGQVKLMDLGIAKRGDQNTRDHLTSTGVIIGTPSYMSPEQASGDPVTYQSDIFSLGTMFYEILSGSKPFHADTNLNLITLIAQCRYKPLHAACPHLPPDIVRIVHTAMAKDPRRRYATAGQMIKDINLFLEGISQLEIRKFLKKFYEAAALDPPNQDWSFFHKLPHLDATLTLTPAEETKNKSGSPSVNQTKKIWIIGAVACIVCFCLGLSLPYLYERLIPVQRFGADPYGTVTLNLKSTDPDRLQDTRIYINEREFPRADNLENEFSLHYFRNGWNSLKIQFPLIYQIYDYQFYFDKPSDARSLNVDVDDLVRQHNQYRAEGRKYGFAVLSEPRDVSVYFNNDFKNLIARSPSVLSYLTLKQPVQKISLQKNGYRTKETEHRFENDRNYLIRIDMRRDADSHR